MLKLWPRQGESVLRTVGIAIHKFAVHEFAPQECVVVESVKRLDEGVYLGLTIGPIRLEVGGDPSQGDAPLLGTPLGGPKEQNAVFVEIAAHILGNRIWHQFLMAVQPM